MPSLILKPYLLAKMSRNIVREHSALWLQHRVSSSLTHSELPHGDLAGHAWRRREWLGNAFINLKTLSSCEDVREHCARAQRSRASETCFNPSDALGTAHGDLADHA